MRISGRPPRTGCDGLQAVWLAWIGIMPDWRPGRKGFRRLWIVASSGKSKLTLALVSQTSTRLARRAASSSRRVCWRAIIRNSSLRHSASTRFCFTSLYSRPYSGIHRVPNALARLRASVVAQVIPHHSIDVVPNGC